MTAPYRSSSDKFLGRRGPSRIPLLRWWFVVLVIVGLTLAALVLFRLTRDVRSNWPIGLATSPAYAEAQASSQTERGPGPRVFVMWGVFIVLAFVYLGGIYKILFSTNAANVDAAGDLVKTLTGFFVGTATNVLGVG